MTYSAVRRAVVLIGMVFVVIVALSPAGAPGTAHAGEEGDQPPAAQHQHPTWGETIEAIAKSPTYGGLRVREQRNLAPLGPDSASGLYEFAVEGSGVVPRRDAQTKRLILTDDFAVVLVLIPGGTFWMGAQKENVTKPNFDPKAEPAESPIHEVTVPALLLGKYECTQAQWRALTGGKAPSHFAAGEAAARRPVERVTWDDCVRVLGAHGLALPTEAQWEYASRAGTRTPWWTGADEEGLSEAAWFRLNSEGTTHPVGEKSANAFGLHDVHGNVREWCQDTFAAYATEARSDPLREPRSDRRATRGGTLNSPAEWTRTSYRLWSDPAVRYPVLGVRPAGSLVGGDSPPLVRDSPEWVKVCPEQIAEASKHGVPVAFENDLGMQFVLIPAGKFRMGSPDTEEWRRKNERLHEVELTRPYYMQITEVTNKQFRRCRPRHDSGTYRLLHRDGNRRLVDHSLNGDLQPVVKVSWVDATAFAAWLGSRDKSRTYRLPTEAEWEHACRGGTRTRFWWGESASDGHRYANAYERAHLRRHGGRTWRGDDGHLVAAPVAAYAANRWGLHEMLGNVSEWCADWYYKYWEAYSGKNPKGASSGTSRVVRGGSWLSGADRARSACRNSWHPLSGSPSLGFRLVSPVPRRSR